jgi:hypothetical protein
MYRGFMTLMAVLGAALPALAQDSDLRKEVEQLKEKVKALEATKAAPTLGNDAALMDLSDTTILDTLMKETKFSGFIDTGFIFNIDRPQNGQNGAVGAPAIPAGTSVRAFDRKSRSFYLHNAQLNTSRAATKEMIVGYNLELSFGSDANTFGTADSNLGDFFDVQEANVQILMPVGNGLLWTFGKFATFAGMEVIESKDNWNYSRSLPFLFAIPFTHTGARATYGFNEQITASLGVNNGWDVAVDNNDAKTLEFNLTVAPIAWFKGLVNFYYGAEKSPSASGHNLGDKRMLLDIVATVQEIPGAPGFSFGLNIDFGSEDDSDPIVTGSAEDAKWTGFALYARYQINPEWAAAIRYSMLDDADLFRTGGFAPGTVTTAEDNTLSEITLTLEYTPVKGLKTRLEFRMDMSDEDAFLDDGGSSDDSQSTLGAEVILEF